MAFLAAAALAIGGCASPGASTSTGASTSPAATNALLDEAMGLLQKAEQHTTTWDGPTSGPKAQTGKLVVYVAQDMRNGGVLGVSKGVQEAAAAIGWQLKIIDGLGTVNGRVAAINQAVALKPAGIILGSVDAQEEAAPIRAAAQAGIKIVGWHSAAAAGPVSDPPIVTNVTTEATGVAKVAAAFAIQQTHNAAGAVIFWQSGDAIGIKKAETMRSVIQACSGCTVLDYVNTPLAETSTRMPGETSSLLQRFGNKWTIGLGINDLYFDFASPALQSAGVPTSGPPQFISAGDGSVAAFQRVRSGQYQIATVAEPLNEAGWQLIDELNRAIAGEAPSGYVAPVHIVTKDNIQFDGGPNNLYDPDNGYRDQYKKIWGVS
ncbi:MAG: substrate-binding domain-containing protein [Chloroflexi bacterium]|nr:MAG: substrate-binding domain-containing protein [Chloroflexota bacterium]